MQRELLAARYEWDFNWYKYVYIPVSYLLWAFWGEIIFWLFRQFAELRETLDPTGKFLNPHLADLFGEPFNA